MKLPFNTIALILFPSLLCNAQEYEYVPFPKENASWHIDNLSMDCPPSPALCSQSTMALADDTTINGLTYTKINSVYLGEITSSILSFFREDTAERKVYGLFWDGEYLVYDFSLMVGDTFFVPPPLSSWPEANEFYIITSIDTILVGNSLRKKFTFTGDATIEESSFWIEGIGGGSGPLMSHYVFESWSILRCFNLHLDLLYSEPFPFPPQHLLQQYPWYEYCDTNVVGVEELTAERSLLNVYPNPAIENLIINVENDLDIVTINVIDALGRFALSTFSSHYELDVSTLTPGIYIVMISLENGTHTSTKFLKQ